MPVCCNRETHTRAPTMFSPSGLQFGSESPTTTNSSHTCTSCVFFVCIAVWYNHRLTRASHMSSRTTTDSHTTPTSRPFRAHCSLVQPQRVSRSDSVWVVWLQKPRPVILLNQPAWSRPVLFCRGQPPLSRQESGHSLRRDWHQVRSPATACKSQLCFKYTHSLCFTRFSCRVRSPATICKYTAWL